MVIPAFDAGATLGDQLEALATQQGAPPFEVIVADDAPSPRPAGIPSPVANS